MTLRETTEKDWRAEGERLFGQDTMQWRFICPSCGHVASVRDWKEAGATDGQIAYSCIGRSIGADGTNAFNNNGGPCNYAGGGLFGLNPVRINFPSGESRDTFEFADILPQLSGTAIAAIKGEAK